MAESKHIYRDVEALEVEFAVKNRDSCTFYTNYLHHITIGVTDGEDTKSKREENHGDDENSKKWDIVQDCLIIIVTHYELYKRPQTFWEWARSLVLMAKQYDGKYFCEILTAIGEAQSRAFLIALAENSNETHTWTAMGLIELLLGCSEQEGRYPTDETRSCIPFGFWYALQDDLATLDQPLENRALEALKPIYFRLAQALLRNSTLPTSPSERGNADERVKDRQSNFSFLLMLCTFDWY